MKQEPMVKAIFFEKAAIERGLKIGFKKDFQWVESLDDRIWCLLTSKSAIDFADSLNLEKEAVEGGAYSIINNGKAYEQWRINRRNLIKRTKV